ncbi:aminotransferase class I/II-fold pyridoxal phosphate-dependent enzyme [Crocinitomicaceae bacterium]|nr:aminotransferase class I/II-fold pyridoxal phosphate-dependent enzyme [Crocinitomicaceae bacterium]
MKMKDFKLERYFAQHEFTAKYLLSSSDCDGYGQDYVLDRANPTELKMWNDIKLGYTESAGNPILRESITQFYKTKNIEEVVVGSPGELNYITMRVLLEKQDHVVAVSPAYQSLHEVVHSIGCEISYWTPNENWAFDPSQLEHLVRKNTKLIIINFPHNPTGSYLTLSELNQIVSIAKKNDCYIFSDEMYHKLLAKSEKELPPISDLYSKGISLWGTSKSFGLAGLRTGWLVCNDLDFIHRVICYKDYLSICSSAPSEILSIIALNHIDDFLQPNIKKIQQNINLFAEFAQTQDVISSFIPPKSGSTAFVKLNINCSSLEFSNYLVEKAGIMTIPAEMFDHPGKFIRVGFGRESLPKILPIMRVFLEQNKQILS